jgi:hypothetical protein
VTLQGAGRGEGGLAFLFHPSQDPQLSQVPLGQPLPWNSLRRLAERMRSGALGELQPGVGDWGLVTRGPFEVTRSPRLGERGRFPTNFFFFFLQHWGLNSGPTQ